MSPFQMIVAGAAPNAENGAALSGVVVVTLVVVAILGAVIWGSIRLRAVNPVLKKSVSNIREERFASEVLREFLPDGQHAAVGTQGIVPKPAPGPDASSKDSPLLADEGVSGGVVGDLENFYANALTSKPLRAAGPATGTLTYGSSRPEVSGEFGEAVREFVEGIRGLATAVEQAALGDGSELDRATRSVDTFTRGLAVLQINDVLVSAGRDVAAAGSVPEGTHRTA